MSLYAEHPARRARQVAGDLLVLLWVLLWVAVGTAVHDQVARLAEPGRTLESAGTSLEEGLRAAGSGVARVPLLGEQLRSPFETAGGAAASITDAGVAVQVGVARTAVLAGVAVAVWPIVLVAGLWLLHRWRAAHRAAAARRVLDAGGKDLLALRVLATAPLSRVASVAPDAAGAWRRGDRDVVDALAAIGLRDLGLRAGPQNPDISTRTGA